MLQGHTCIYLPETPQEIRKEWKIEHATHPNKIYCQKFLLRCTTHQDQGINAHPFSIGWSIKVKKLINQNTHLIWKVNF